MFSYFPYQKPRPTQIDCMQTIQQAIDHKTHAIIHAPTGIGKTAASLAPTVEYAIQNDKIVVFLTSRHTQHVMALQTLEKMQEKQAFGVIDFVAKQHMCLIAGVHTLKSNDFSAFCKDSREHRSCEFYTNTKKSDGELTSQSQAVVDNLKNQIVDTSGAIKTGKTHSMCPYEVASASAQHARVIIADYSYIFNAYIQNSLLNRIKRSLEDIIVIVDEAHNLPSRVIDMASTSLSTLTMRRAIAEADRNNKLEILTILQDINAKLDSYIDNTEQPETLVTQQDFENLINDIGNYKNIQELLEETGEKIRENKRHSSILAVAQFMTLWQDQNQAITRILSIEGTKEKNVILKLTLLDPASITGPIIEDCHSVICMSGTLLPTSMYQDILGIQEDKCVCKELDNPFPKHNALHWVVPSHTTQYKQRNEKTFQEMADNIVTITNQVPGLSAVFFPSYAMRDSIGKYVQSNQQILYEQQQTSKQQREQLLEEFKQQNKAILFAVTSGSFGEGINIPENLLQCVIIVGLPLAKPDLETQERIQYYQDKFGKGWDYAYVYPAFTKTLQNAGRCIRSETDKGMIVYLDKRYTWPQYRKCFPNDLNMVISDKLHIPEIFYNAN